MKHYKAGGKFGNRMRRLPTVTKTPTGNRIRLHEFYPDYQGTEKEIEVSDDVLNCMMTAFREEHSYSMELCRHFVPIPFDEQKMGDLYGITESSSEEIYEIKETAQKLYHAMRQIDSLQAKCFYLYYAEEMTIQQIASRIGISSPKAWRSIQRAVAALRKLMRDSDE